MSALHHDDFVSVTYLKLGHRADETYDEVSYADGSGAVRLRLGELPDWLSRHPGAMVCSITLLHRRP